MKALVTGATGFIGSSIVRRLIDNGKEVKALVRQSSDTHNIDHLDIEIVRGDITDKDSLTRAMKGCNVVYHAAAMVAFWVPRDLRERFFYVNVDGSKNVFITALDQDVERVIYTSTLSAIGSFGKDNPTTEEHQFNLWNMSMDYERSKYSAEFEAWRFAARGLPLVVVSPSAPIGPRDYGPNPTGQLILNFLSRKLPGYIDGGANFLHVDDAADAHLLAAKHGSVGERYLIGAANLTVTELFAALESVSGIPAPKLKLPYAGAVALAYLLEFVADHITHKHPMLTVPMTKFTSLYYFIDTTKAEHDLGYTPKRTVQQAAIEAIGWFLENGYVRVDKKVESTIRRRLADQGMAIAAA